MTSEQKLASTKQTPVIPEKESYRRVLKELEVTKDKSFFVTHSLENPEGDGIEELFYQQVRFLQKCKEIARGTR